jgi:site-specific DNA recombinase
MADKFIAGYTRVSTEMQVDHDSLTNQEERIKAYALAKGREYRIYKDPGVSAVASCRPMFGQMLADIKAGLIDTVVVSKLDRLIRSLKDLINLLEYFQKHNVNLVSLTETLDFSTAFGRFGLQLLGAVAELERGITSERVASDMKGRANRGKWNGGIVSFGFKWVPKQKTIEVNVGEAAVVKKIFNCYLRLKSFRGVVHYLNSSGYKTRTGRAWSSTTIKRILRNPQYCGTMTYNKRYNFGSTSRPRALKEHMFIQDVFQPIISKEIFQETSVILREQIRIPPRVMNSQYLLTGLVRCGVCGYGMNGCTYHDIRKPGRIFSYYKCKQHAEMGKSVCPGNTIKKQELDDLIINELKSFVVNSAKLKDKIKDFEDEFNEETQPLIARFKLLQAKAGNIEGRIAKIFELYEDALITQDEFSMRKSNIEKEKELTEKEIIEIESKLQEKPNVGFSVTLDNIKNLADVFDELNIYEKKELLRTIIAEIRVWKHEVEYDLYGYPDVISYESHRCLRNYDQQKLQSKITLSVSRYPDSTFSEKLRKYRLSAGLKQSELARQLGVDEMTVVNWEIGRNKPCKKYRKKVSELLLVS